MVLSATRLQWGRSIDAADGPRICSAWACNFAAISSAPTGCNEGRAGRPCSSSSLTRPSSRTVPDMIGCGKPSNSGDIFSVGNWAHPWMMASMCHQEVRCAAGNDGSRQPQSQQASERVQTAGKPPDHKPPLGRCGRVRGPAIKSQRDLFQCLEGGSRTTTASKPGSSSNVEKTFSVCMLAAKLRTLTMDCLCLI